MKFLIKSQAAMEFILLLAILLGIFLVFFIKITDEAVNISKEKEYEIVKDIAHMIQVEITSSFYLENGYRRTIILPETMEGINYSLNITNDNIVVTSRNHEYVLYIPPINGTITKGNNSIIKENDTLYVKQN